MSKQSPKRGVIYTFREICENLELRDRPHLGFTHNNIRQVVQDSHMREDELLALPQWADSEWLYEYETDEWIPIFRFVSDQGVKIDDLVTMEPLLDPHATHDGVLWVIPKGTERKQNYRLVPATDDEPAYLVSEYSEIHWPVPVFDADGLSATGRRDRDDPGVCDDCDANVDVRLTYRHFEEGSCARQRHVCRHCLDSYRTYCEEQAD